ncbi:hypothetical protein [Arthrobacter sp.]|uniref:hypothetical protein n=1 Tax=Arthrobacter sp. TaxID=1667 RepID=UPI003A9190A6
MLTVAIVHYARHAPTRDYAQALENELRGTGHLAEQIRVSEAAANDIVFYDALVLVGPPRFGRLHGIALARAIAPERSSAVVIMGGTRPAESYHRLFKSAERPYISLFHENDGGAGFATLSPVMDWLGGRERP